MTSQPPDAERYGMFLLACLLVSFVAQSVGLVVGAAMNVQVRIYFYINFWIVEDSLNVYRIFISKFMM